MARYLTTAEAAELCRATPETLRGWRYERKGPAWFRPEGSRRVLYAADDVLSWLEAARAQQTA